VENVRIRFHYTPQVRVGHIFVYTMEFLFLFFNNTHRRLQAGRFSRTISRPSRYVHAYNIMHLSKTSFSKNRIIVFVRITSRKNNRNTRLCQEFGYNKNARENSFSHTIDPISSGPIRLLREPNFYSRWNTHAVENPVRNREILYDFRVRNERRNNTRLFWARPIGFAALRVTVCQYARRTCKTKTTYTRIRAAREKRVSNWFYAIFLYSWTPTDRPTLYTHVRVQDVQRGQYIYICTYLMETGGRHL